VLGQFPQRVLVDFPLWCEVMLVEQQDKRQGAHRRRDRILQLSRGGERGESRAVDDEQVTGHAGELRRRHFLVIVLSVDVPQHQRDVLSVDVELLLVDFHADRRDVLLRVQTVDVSRHQTRLADGVCAQHADLHLNHDGSDLSAGCRRA
jgi:hypothetical protein